MPDLGLFPLDVVLLPGEALPLHLFEPRYRQLYADSVLDDTPFVMVRSTADGTEDIGCTARFETLVRRHEDGRLDVVVRGAERVELGEATAGRPYMSALVHPLPDTGDAAQPEQGERVLAHYREVVGPDAATPDVSQVPLSYAVAGALALDPDSKQALLAERSEAHRLEMLTEALRRATELSRHSEEAARRGRTNGKVSHP